MVSLASEIILKEFVLIFLTFILAWYSKFCFYLFLKLFFCSYANIIFNQSLFYWDLEKSKSHSISSSQWIEYSVENQTFGLSYRNSKVSLSYITIRLRHLCFMKTFIWILLAVFKITTYFYIYIILKEKKLIFFCLHSFHDNIILISNLIGLSKTIGLESIGINISLVF